MESGGCCLSLLILFHLYQGMMCSLHVSPKYLVANRGDEATFSCKYNGGSGDKLDICQFTVGGVPYFLKPSKERDGITFHGDLTKGDCGIKIHPVEDKHNGNISCLVGPDSADPTAPQGYMQLVVALEPQPPVMEVSPGMENNPNTYRERDEIKATCIVRDGRPAANISWYMGDEQLTEGLTIPVESCTPQMNDLCTIQQNISRNLLASDNNKALKCVASHQALKGRTLVAEHNINVLYPPKPSAPIKRYGLVEGVTGNVPISIEANPKPIITWTIGGDVVYENSNNGRYTVLPTVAKESGQFESVLLIDKLTQDDMRKDYTVTAHNTMGEANYQITVSTKSQPSVLERGGGFIIFIVVGAILLILVIVAGTFYARAKGKCCFAAVDAEKRVAPPNEGTENPAVNHHASSEYISNSPQLKKEKPKEDTPV